MHTRSLTSFVLVSLLLTAAAAPARAQSAPADSLQAAPASEQQPPEQLNSPAPDARQVFQRGLEELRESFQTRLVELQAAAKTATDGPTRAAAEAERVLAKQQYERDLVQLQLDLARAEGHAERVAELEALQKRTAERHARSGEGSR